jgi:predicted permease
MNNEPKNKSDWWIVPVFFILVFGVGILLGFFKHWLRH